jgi:hypothetical protein
MADLITNAFPKIRLVHRRAGASYAGHPCVDCGVPFVGDTRIIIEKERGNYIADGWKLYKRVCHTTFEESDIVRFVAWLERQTVPLRDS